MKKRVTLAKILTFFVFSVAGVFAVTQTEIQLD
jgi:hypothetical protein